MVPFIIQVWMYASPIVYPIQTIPEGIWRSLYGLNPMAGVIQGFRWALLGGTPPDLTMLISSGMVLALLISGLFYFRRMEKTFADLV
jgi:lipopolysaccharide transport system permease protein